MDGANLAFKIQVQEWQNVPLRGGDEAPHNRYWQQFQDEEKRVQTQIGQLIDTAESAELRQRLNELRAAHAAIAAGAQQSTAARVQAGERLHSITQAVEAIRDMNRQIATAAEEQTSVAEDIARNLAEMVSIAQSNQADLQRSESASRAMQGLSGDLWILAARFTD